MDPGYLVARAAHWWPDATAVSADGQHRTYAQLDDRARRLATALRERGLAAGDRVAVLSGNRVEYPEIDLGIAYAGLVRVALNARLTVDEFSYTVEDADVRALISAPSNDAEAVELADRHRLDWFRLGFPSPDVPATPVETALAEAAPGPRHHPAPTDPAWISYTSGTTGRPKGVVLSHHGLSHVLFNMMIGLGPIGPRSSILLPQPLSHGAGFFSLAYLAAGGTVHIMDKFDPEAVYALGTRNAIETLKVVPAMLGDLLDTAGQSSYSTIIYGAAPITETRVETALDRFGPVLVQIYGQSEAPVTITRLSKEEHALPGEHRRSAGRPWPSTRTEVLTDDGRPAPVGEIGEVVVSGDHIMTGYHNLPSRTAEVLRDGRIWTRDMAVTDDRGFVHLRGRKDDMINSGGFNIAPKEIEDVVNRHSDIDECVAVGIPHDRWGQAVRVYVRARPGRTVDGAEVAEFCRPSLGFRRPRSVVVVTDIPRTPYGKVDREALTSGSPEQVWTE